MKHGREALLAVAVVLSLAGADKRKERPRRAMVTVSGCLDQRGESYVLRGDRELKVKYTLKADGFSDDNFARHLGHRVEVRGAGDSGETFRVREIKTLSDTCEPATEKEQAD
jgi:hypothetical protein